MVSNDVEITVNIELCVKQAKNLPFGAKLMETIGDLIRWRQSTSVISVVTVSTITTELSEVDRNTSGWRDEVWKRGRTAMERNETLFSL